MYLKIDYNTPIKHEKFGICRRTKNHPNPHFRRVRDEVSFATCIAYKYFASHKPTTARPNKGHMFRQTRPFSPLRPNTEIAFGRVKAKENQ